VRKILVVDDFVPFRRFVSSLLEQRGAFHVTEVSDGLEAVHRTEELHPDLILLDIGMPGLDGIEVARRVRGLVPAAKILFCSQESSPEVVREALTLGLGYIHKSHTHRDLFPAIEAVLSGRRFVSRNLDGGEAAAVAFHHEVLFGSDDAALLEGLARFIATALKGGDAAAVWATESHRETLLESLRLRGVDIEAAIWRGTYRAADVSEPPDREGLVAILIGLKQAAAKTGNKYPRVAVCGERAGRLWAEGQTDAAIHIEKLFNELAKSHEIDILCVYPFPVGEGNEESVKAICAEHAVVSCA